MSVGVPVRTMKEQL